MANAWSIELSPEAEEALRTIAKKSKRAAVTIDRRVREELTYAPFIETGNKKALKEIPEHLAHYGMPIWQLKIYPYRIRYGLDATGFLKILVVEMFRKDKEGKGS